MNFHTTCGGRGIPKRRGCLGGSIMNLWERLGHNPIRLLLQEIEPRAIETSRPTIRIIKNYTKQFLRFRFVLFRTQTIVDASKRILNLIRVPVAYFSMEFGLHETLPIYSGGLGVLAGDHLERSERSWPAAHSRSASCTRRDIFRNASAKTAGRKR
jgi:hypothetical protein